MTGILTGSGRRHSNRGQQAILHGEPGTQYVSDRCLGCSRWLSEHRLSEVSGDSAYSINEAMSKCGPAHNS